MPNGRFLLRRKYLVKKQILTLFDWSSMMPAACVNLVVIAKLKRATMRMWYEIRFRGSIRLRASRSSWHLSLGWTEWRKLWLSISCAIGRIKTNYRPRRNLLKLRYWRRARGLSWRWNQFVSWTRRRDARRVDSLASERNFHLLKQETYHGWIRGGGKAGKERVPERSKQLALENRNEWSFPWTRD